jgi:hypothetical protein
VKKDGPRRVLQFWDLDGMIIEINQTVVLILSVVCRVPGEMTGVNPVRNSIGVLNAVRIILKCSVVAEKRNIFSNGVKVYF